MEYEKGKVSVIIPTYRRADTLARAIKSVAEQTYKNIEILVVDDNEPGDEYSIEIKKLVQSLPYKNLFLVTQERHINGAAARNAGIRKAVGEYIAFLDDDDLWMPEKIKVQVNVLSKLDKTYGGVSTRKIYYLNNKQDHISEVWKYKKSQSFDIMAKKLNVSTCTLLLRHVCLDETGYFDENLRRHQEIQLLSFFTSKYKLKFIDEILTVIDCSDTDNRPNAEGLMKTKIDYFKSIEPLLKNFRKHKKNLVVAHNLTEVAWVFYRDGNRLKGIGMLIKCLIYPSVCLAFFNRILEKKAARMRLQKYDSKILTSIQRCIEASK